MQRVSLAAFVLAMGDAGSDNAIVIIDGILVDLKAGKDRMEAMTAIGRQTAHAVAGSYTDRHHRFLADLYVTGYGRCLYARSFYRTCRFFAAQLGVGVGSCTVDG